MSIAIEQFNQLLEKWITHDHRHIWITERGAGALGSKEERYAVDKFIGDVQDLKLNKDSDVQKFHDAKMAFLAEQGCSKKSIDEFQDRMNAFTDGFGNPKEVALAKTANKVTGRSATTGIRPSEYISKSEFSKEKITAADEKVFRLNAMANQAMLKARFGEEVQLTRGICKAQARDVINSAKNRKVDVGVGALSSWTDDTLVSSSFAFGKAGATKQSSGVLLASKVKTSNIMDSHYTNPALRGMGESEFVMMGTSKIKGATLYKSTLAKDAKLDIDIWAK